MNGSKLLDTLVSEVNDIHVSIFICGDVGRSFKCTRSRAVVTKSHEKRTCGREFLDTVVVKIRNKNVPVWSGMNGSRQFLHSARGARTGRESL